MKTSGKQPIDDTDYADLLKQAENHIVYVRDRELKQIAFSKILDHLLATARRNDD